MDQRYERAHSIAFSGAVLIVLLACAVRVTSKGPLSAFSVS
jgi:hypothetical protein